MLTRREMFEDLPGIADEICSKLFSVDGKPAKSVAMDLIESIAKRTSASQLTNLITTVMEAF